MSDEELVVTKGLVERSFITSALMIMMALIVDDDGVDNDDLGDNDDKADNNDDDDVDNDADDDEKVGVLERSLITSTAGPCHPGQV